MKCTEGTGVVAQDHRNYDDYRSYTLIVTYEGDDAAKLDKYIVARADIRYTDANGWVRVFYNDCKPNKFYGGYKSSFNDVKAGARPPENPNDNSEWIMI